jgi:hypothetical protein
MHHCHPPTNEVTLLLIIDELYCVRRQTGRLTVGRNITLTLTLNPVREEAGSNTSTVTQRVVGGDEKGKSLI